ncbi:MAG: hypothetical protein BAJATHORv1_30216 [Candidatus Thorarchaeota archaeon]|nr:MAG: hypothetical protein BAJATHORv1_30216 [Candidatus Thorarchaeota archaeon]
MIFRCRNCGNTSADIDMVLDGACTCGCTSFQLVEQEPAGLNTGLPTKEMIRQDLHSWIDLNLDALKPEQIYNIRVRFEAEE